MRFKKLKLILGIALVAFILVVGNTIAFGLLNNKALANNNAQTDIRTITKNSTSAINQNSNTINQNANTPGNSQSSAVAAPVTPSVSSSAPVVVQTRRTRAS